jgi:hypothetical protein
MGYSHSLHSFAKGNHHILPAQHRLRSCRAGNERLPGMTYLPAPDRYQQTPYRRCGRSGIELPEISLGLWQNFGGDWS